MAAESRTPGRPETRISAWRETLLAQAGFDPRLAQAVALDAGYDLHELLNLVDRGCPPHLAVRILAPR